MTRHGSAIEWVVDAADALGARGDVLPILSGCTPANPDCYRCWAAEVAVRRANHPHPNIADRYHGVARRTADGRAVFTGLVRVLEPGFVRGETAKDGTVFFVASESDLFHEDVPRFVILRLFELMRRRRQVRFIVLTKRPQRMAAIATSLPSTPNVILMCSAGHQDAADCFLPAMSSLAAAGWLTGVSSEPRRGHIDWSGWEFLHWLVTGEESAAKAHARRMDIDCARRDRDWAAAHHVRFYLKQAWLDGRLISRPSLDGRQHLATPWCC